MAKMNLRSAHNSSAAYMSVHLLRSNCKDDLKSGLEAFVDVLERKTLHAHHREDEMRSSLSSSAA